MDFRLDSNLSEIMIDEEEETTTSMLPLFAWLRCAWFVVAVYAWHFVF